MNTANKCAVIGAGLVGLCTALEFLRVGLQVTLMDTNPPGKGASYGNAGFIATESVNPLGTLATLKQAPSLLLKKHGPLALPVAHLSHSLPWIARFSRASLPATATRGRQALSSLNNQALDAWKRILKPENLENHLIESGYLRIWESHSGGKAALAEAAFLSHWGIHTVLMKGDEIADIEPNLTCNVTHALYFPHSYRVSDPFWLAEALFNAFLQRGGEFRRGKVSGVKPNNTGVEIYSAGQTIQFDNAVVCAGAKSTALLSPLGLTIPLMAERGYHLSLKNQHGILRRPICSADRNIFINPLDSGLRIVGISELGGTELPAQPKRFGTLRYHAKNLLPMTAERLAEAEEWMGMRPTLPDSLPIIDTHPQCSALGFAFGHQHLGLTLAAITSERIVKRMLMASDINETNHFSVTRFHHY